MQNKDALLQAVGITHSFTDEQVEAFIKLFKISPVPMVPPSGRFEYISKMACAKQGLVFVDNCNNVLNEVPRTIYISAVKCYGNTADLFNQTFYKSFSTVNEKSIYELVFDQMLHYLTTYGAEAAGVQVPTYVPVQALEIPDVEFNTDFKFTVIQVLPNVDCTTRLDEYLKSLTAPSVEIRSSIQELLPRIGLATEDIKSFEIQVMKHRLDDTVPSHPISQLRYLIYLTTSETLIIKNRYLREQIQKSPDRHSNLAYTVLTKCCATELATIFFRYKPLFLAFKQHSQCAPIINDLRRKAEIYHVPLKMESVQNFLHITDPKIQMAIAEKATNREIIKIINAARARLFINDDKPAVYAVRNGRTFVKDNGLRRTECNPIIPLVDILLARLTPILEGKIFLLPNYINYAIPTSEKQFIGNIPFGSQIYSRPENGAFTVGIQWFNQERNRVDIDLHLNSATQHFGWNGDYRSRSKDIVYSGDQTDAPLPNGAAEAYWFEPTEEGFIVSVNLYSGPKDTEFKLFMTNTKPDTLNGLYTYDPNDSVFPPISMKFNGDNETEKNIGLFINEDFYFYGGMLGGGVVPNANYRQYIEGLIAQLDSKLDIKTLLVAAGATIITSTEGYHPDHIKDMISLAPEDLTIDTLFNIIDGKI